MAWFRRQREQPTAPEPPATEQEPEPAPFVAAREDRPSAGDWMAMPAMARTVGPPPSRLSNVQRISDMMTTRRPLALTGTLGHRVSPLAPAGSVEGLATAVDRPVEVDGGGGDLTLRAPLPREVPAAEAVQREVPVTTSATPSLPTLSEARLPQPPPARALQEPLPLPGRDVGAENPPRPLAVVQRQPAASTSSVPSSAPAASSSSTSENTPADTAPVSDPSEDAPVGGTPLRPVSMPEPAVGDSDDAPPGVQTGDGTVVDLPLASTAGPSVPMENVMPPIQPRAIQRRAAEAAGASARPETAADAPLPPLPDWARPAQPKSEDASASAPPPSPSMPLQHPTVQREAAPSAGPVGAAASAARMDETEDADDAASTPGASASVAAPSAPSAAADGSTDTHADAHIGAEIEARGDTSAPLVGDAAPLAATGAGTELTPDVAGTGAGEVGEAGDGLDLPLHASASSPAATHTADEGPEPNTWNAPSERGPSDRAPEPEPAEPEPAEPAIQRMADDGAGATASPDTNSAVVPLLGDRPLPLFGQPASETGTVSGAAVATPSTRTGEALPLAPDGSSTGGPTLATPPSASTPSALAAPARSAPTPSSTSPGGPAPSMGVQREPLAGGTSSARPTGNATASTGGVALPLRALPSVPERPAASPGAGGPLTDPLPVTPPAGAPPIPAMDAPLAMHAIPSMPSAAAGAGTAAGTATATLPDIATTAALAMPAAAVQTQRAPGAAAALGPNTSTAPTTHAAPMPLQAPVQRSVDASLTPGASHGGSPGASGTSPSIGDLAIASGLAVRQPDGSVLFTRQEPPPSIDGAPIQRSVGVSPPNGSAVQRAISLDEHGGGDGGAGKDGPPSTMPDLDLLARRLLPRFRRLLATEARTGRGRLGESPWNRH